MNATLIEMRCTICLRPFLGTFRAKRKNRLGPKPQHADCWSARDRIDGIIRGIRERISARTRCPFCDATPAPGSKYCPRHMFRREPCDTFGCKEPVRRNEGQGNQPRRCETCRGRKRKSFSAGAAGSAGA
jgi:hypothetical protein